jgi:hypothetical protein
MERNGSQPTPDQFNIEPINAAAKTKITVATNRLLINAINRPLLITLVFCVVFILPTL